MKNVRTFRIILAIVFFLATVALLAFGEGIAPILKVARLAQIIPSAIASTIGVTLFWLGLSFLFGRVYCSTVCPVGTLQDIAFRIRRAAKPGKPFSYSHPSRWRYEILLVYVICLLLGISTVCAILEPWPLFANAIAAIRPEDATGQWPGVILGGAVGIIVSIVVLLAIFITAFFNGREFCNAYCPIGSALGSFHERTLFHIEIDPDKCSGCLKCEDVCRSRCIKVVSRYVDNSRCVRCFDCIHACDDNAIRFQINRNRRPATPLLRKQKKA